MAGMEEEKLSQLRQKKLISGAEYKKYAAGQYASGAGETLQQYNNKLKQNSVGLRKGNAEGYGRAFGSISPDPIDGKFPVGDLPTGSPVWKTWPAKSTANDSQALIDSIYEKSRESQLTALEGQYTQQANEYNKQKGEAPEKFDPLRNEAYVNKEMAERSRKESMANMGLSGAGGMSQTLEQRNTGNLLNTLGGISRQQQDYTDNINFALGQLTTQYDSSKNSINLQIDSEKNRAALDQGNWEKNFGLQEEQFGLSKSDSEFNRYIQLLSKGVINKKQFKAKFPDLF